jgi:hypothetical protein
MTALKPRAVFRLLRGAGQKIGNRKIGNRKIASLIFLSGIFLSAASEMMINGSVE